MCCAFQELFREHQESDQKMKSDYDVRRKQEEIEDRTVYNMKRSEKASEQETHKVLWLFLMDGYYLTWLCQKVLVHLNRV